MKIVLLLSRFARPFRLNAAHSVPVCRNSTGNRDPRSKPAAKPIVIQTNAIRSQNNNPF